MKTTTTKDPTLLAQTNIVRLLEANLKVITQETTELEFRRALIKQVAAVAADLNAGLITRLYEAVCAVDFPKHDVTKLRTKLQTVIAANLSLSLPSTKPSLSTPNN